MSPVKTYILFYLTHRSQNWTALSKRELKHYQWYNYWLSLTYISGKYLHTNKSNDMFCNCTETTDALAFYGVNWKVTIFQFPPCWGSIMPSHFPLLCFLLFIFSHNKSKLFFRLDSKSSVGKCFIKCKVSCYYTCRAGGVSEFLCGLSL